MHAFKMALVAALSTATLGACALGNQSFDVVETKSSVTLPGKGYSAIYVAPVEIDLDRKAEERRIGIRTRNIGFADVDKTERAEALRETLIEELSKKYVIVDIPSDDALTVAATVTRLEPSRPTVNQLNREIALEFTDSFAAGSAAIEIQLLNNDAEIASFEDFFKATLQDGRPRIAVWTDVDRAYEEWSRKLSIYIRDNRLVNDF